MTENKINGIGSLKLFGNVKVLTSAALFMALSVVLKVLAINLSDTIRIGFENLPILIAGIFFGPFIGGVVGVGADLVGCLVKGYEVNPIITVGAFCVGFVSGFIAQFIFKNDFTAHKFGKIVACVMSSYLIGSIIIKSIGMTVFFGSPFIPLILTRIPVCIATGSVEAGLIYLLMRSSVFNSAIERLCKK